ncbi:MAG: Proline--tRNA ligase [Candidatus Methanolliviera sp. GoM_oil]|nr:MAG: Proline--tRNA ligase [Candidatus Methanolliviera sp. GoM_oil]
MEDLTAMCKRRGFIYPAFETYGGVAGFYDYGPLGSLMKKNIEELWRSFYLSHKNFAEIACPAIVPEAVLKASGHVDRFTDFVSTCPKCKSSYRANRLLKEEIDSSSLTFDGMRDIFKSGKIKCSKCGEKLTEISAFNLMFETKIGGDLKGFLRPETAQGIFINFPNMYRYFREKLPFGVVQIGRGYRNEISPRQGMIRLREFNMAEVEFFFDDPLCKEFEGIKDEKLNIFPKDGHEIELKAHEIYDKNIIRNQSQIYFMVLTRKFLIEAGVDPGRLRFRQHHTQEMAHYAKDCWDVEVYLDEWTEVAGIADRGTYDLDSHMRSSGKDFSVERKRKKIRIKEEKMEEVKKIFDKTDLIKKIEEMEFDENADIDEITIEKITLKKEFFDQYIVKKGKFVPSVIEPSYGIDRILYSILFHNFKQGVLALPPKIAPIKFGVFPLLRKKELKERARDVFEMLNKNGTKCYYDEGGSIGRRYARMDEIGTPFCITVDHQTLEDSTITIRFRDAREQIRVNIKDLAEKVRDLLG